MIEIKSNFWDIASKYQVLVCTTNQIVKKDGRLVMGAGIAKDFKEKYQDIDKIWGEQTLKYPNQGIFACSSEDDKLLLSFPTKTHWKNKSDLDLIEQSLAKFVLIINCLGIETVLMTRPGCGMGGLKWEDVKPVVTKYLDERFTVVYNE